MNSLRDLYSRFVLWLTCPAPDLKLTPEMERAVVRAVLDDLSLGGPITQAVHGIVQSTQHRSPHDAR